MSFDEILDLTADVFNLLYTNNAWSEVHVRVRLTKYHYFCFTVCLRDEFSKFLAAVISFNPPFVYLYFMTQAGIFQIFNILGIKKDVSAPMAYRPEFELISSSERTTERVMRCRYWTC